MSKEKTERRSAPNELTGRIRSRLMNRGMARPAKKNRSRAAWPVSGLISLQRRLTALTATAAGLIAQFRELNQLRERVRKAQLTAQDTEEAKWDENLTVAIETYLANEVHTPEQAKAKAMERSGIKDRRTAFHIVRDPPPDKQ